jgi:hypothetical protein
MSSSILGNYSLKVTSVLRKLRWVENGVNRWVGTSDRGAGHYFVDLVGAHLDFTLFPCQVSTAQFTVKFLNNR